MEGLQELAQGLEAEVFVHAFRHATALPCRFGAWGGVGLCAAVGEAACVWVAGSSLALPH